MLTIRKLTLTGAMATAATLAVAMLSTTPALADSGHRDNVIRAALVGSMPAPASPTIARKVPGAAPWVNGPSSVRIRDNGRIDVRIRGLIVPPLGLNPVLSAVATLVCRDMVVASTKAFPLSAAGDGSTRQHISVPKHCHDAVVLIQPEARQDIYIASTVDEEDDD